MPATPRDWQHMAKVPSIKWPADKVERRPINDLVPYARNARTHSDEQVAQIAASIREWGWTTPVLIDDEDGIIAGHGRVMAAKKLGITEIPVIIASGWTDAQKRAYVIADNQLPQNAGWDMDLLKVETQDLDEEKFDLSLIGFDDGFMANMFLEPDFEPGTEDDQGRLDQLEPKLICCPNCGEEFDARGHGKG